MIYSPPPSPKANILIVDDTPNNLRLLSKILMGYGYEVGKAINGSIALQSAQKTAPDIVLLDINMPQMNGYEVCEQLKANPRTQEIPVIFISALDDVWDKVKAFQVGGVDYITKPFQCEEVLARVDTHLRLQSLQNKLRREQQKSERLLLNILPAAIAQELKQNQKANPTQFEDAAFLFVDLVNFTANSSTMAPGEVVSFLNQIFSIFDALVTRYGMEKIRTIGDSYFVAGGLPNPHPDYVSAIADMALEMQRQVAHFSWSNGNPLQLRIGISVGGPVVGAVIGTQKFAYDVWGDVVNLASRMESLGQPGRIQVTEAVYERLRDRYQLECRGKIPVKGQGEMTTYWLVGRTS
ncbi:response regulator [Lusitaniella coriacea LEGE 07157]|uniref:Adenylate cyclase n=1 Tax=Lusitaniella coriacea LEGE 07157 TaxID=945747 RepID=A0A8J7JD76_9CYAN|nr:adenylate/guanylate cyclase domain-containing protein [Lusitaniella coriacea]MBE9117885.1 response regulator [Lusitaniella coriacea LEGE 07157]